MNDFSLTNRARVASNMVTFENAHYFVKELIDKDKTVAEAVYEEFKSQMDLTSLDKNTSLFEYYSYED